MDGGKEKMNFDAIVGNPPYQKLDKGNSVGGSASPLYHHIFNLAKSLNPKLISVVIPARWFACGKGLDRFRKQMLSDTHIKDLVDYTRSRYVFPSVDIKGGVCFFLWKQDHDGKCSYTLNDIYGERKPVERFLATEGSDVLIRYRECEEIFHKVRAFNEKPISEIVSTRKPFKLSTDAIKRMETLSDNETDEYPIAVHGLDETGRVTKYLPSSFFSGDDRITKYKIFVPKSYGCGALGEVGGTPILGTPILGTPNSACTETYLMVGLFETEIEANNALSYIETKTFRLLVGIRKLTQDSPKTAYLFVPQQDFNETWTDEKLYTKYHFTPEEIAFIETYISPMSHDDTQRDNN